MISLFSTLFSRGGKTIKKSGLAKDKNKVTFLPSFCQSGRFEIHEFASTKITSPMNYNAPHINEMKMRRLAELEKIVKFQF